MPDTNIEATLTMSNEVEARLIPEQGIQTQTDIVYLCNPDAIKVKHDETLEGEGTSSSPLKISDEILQEIEDAGKVDDVYVNGSSVLGQDKIARVVVPTKVSDLENDADYQNAQDVATSIATHNTSDSAHQDIRNLISDLSEWTTESYTATTTNFVVGQTYTVEEAFQRTASLFEGQQGEIDDIEALIPAQATTENQLADKNFVNATIATNSANFRGNWSTWANVPTQADQYPEDYVGSRTPTNNDYMVVSDASDYQGDYDKPMSFVVENIGGDAARPGYRYTFFENGVSIAVLTMPNRNSTQQRTQIRDGMYATLDRLSNTYTTELKFYSDSNYSLPLEVKIDNNIVVQYDVYLTGTGNTKTVDLYYSNNNSYTGTWRFLYVGTWATDGKNGWKPVYQIGTAFTQEQQAAIDSGITKNMVDNYVNPTSTASTAYNKRITALETDKRDIINSANKVYATNSQGGNLDTLEYSQSATASTIAQRTAEGELTVATPTTASSATTKDYVDTIASTKQNVLTAGTNISIVNDVISSTAQESFFRGKWNTWSNVPTDANLYPSDYKGSHIPTESDYMVVEDASGFVPGLDIELFIPQTGTRAFTLGGEQKVVPDYPNEVSWVLPDITITASFHNGTHSWFTANKTVKCDNVIYAAGDTFAKILYYSNPGPTIYYSNNDSLSGAWRFSYRGTWATDNISGWKPEYQVEDVLPVASPTEAGIAKLYTTTGSNTDGAIDQNGTTTAINTAVSTHNTASNAHSNIRGTANGLATLDANAKVPLSQMNDAVLGNVSYQGLWNASTNDPFLPNPSGELPAGYTQYGWIKTVSGTPYIDTGISYDYANEDEITVETKLNYLSTARAGYNSFGFTSGNGSIYIWKTWQGVPTVNVGGLGATFASETDTVVSMKVDKVLGQNSITIDGTTTYGATSSFANLNIYVLSANNGGTPSSNQSYVKFYYVNISKSGTLVARLLPCKRNSDDVVGMYDTVRNTFYPVTGGVAEVGGAIEIPKGHYYITSVAGDQFNIHFEVGDWIISNGTSWTKVNNTDAVSSVEGRTGNVTVINDSASTGATTYTWSADKLATQFGNLGTAAYTASTDYATAAQGAKADTALQPADVQEYTANEVETLWNSI